MFCTVPSHLQRQSGFTLLELTSTIVILGTLAGIALPKLADLNSQARIAVLTSTSGAIKSATALTQMQAVLQQKMSGDDGQEVDYSGKQVAVRFSYPSASWSNSIKNVLTIDADTVATPTAKICSDYEFCGAGNIPFNNQLLADLNLRSGQVSVIWMDGTKISDQCFSYYNNPNDGAAPITGTVTSGC